MTVEIVTAHRPRCAVGHDHQVVYFSAPDAFACIDCNRWFEKKCPDEEHCMFCMARPELPSDLVLP